MNLEETRKVIQDISIHQQRKEREEENLYNVFYLFHDGKYNVCTIVITVLMAIATIVYCIATRGFDEGGIIIFISNILLFLSYVIFAVIVWIICSIIFWILKKILILIDGKLGDKRQQNDKYRKPAKEISDRIMEEKEIISDLYSQLANSIVPPDYRHINAIDYFIRLFRNNRVDNIRDAVNMYEQDNTNRQIQMQQKQILQNQQQANKELKKVTNTPYFKNRK